MDKLATELKAEEEVVKIRNQESKQELKRDTIKRRSFINRAAYNKLQRASSVSLGSSSSVSALKSKFENKIIDSELSKSSAHKDKDKGVVSKQVEDEGTLDEEVVVLRKKGPVVPPKPNPAKKVSFSEPPVPAPRSSKNSIEIVKVELTTVEKETVIPVVIKAADSKSDLNSNYLHSQQSLDSIDFADPEDIHFVSRASSIDTIDNIQATLNLFSKMDERPKEKKRSNSFKRILKGSFFGKDKKKEDKKTKKTENAVFADNVQNESSFNRSSAVRHTTGSEFAKTHAQNKEAQQRYQQQQQQQQQQTQSQQQSVNDVEHRYAQMYINRFNQNKSVFSQLDNPKCAGEDYVCMDSGNVKDTKISSTNYINIPSIHKYIDTSSSSNTLDSENLTYDNQIKDTDSNNSNLENSLLIKCKQNNELSDTYMETPPRAHDTHQNVQLVKPKAIIPINSERPLPNPYHTENKNNPNLKTMERNLNNALSKELPNKAHNEFSDGVYGTVFERKITRPQTASPDMTAFNPQSNSSMCSQRTSPKSPSLESSKLRLPAIRDKVDLQPRIRSPIPPSEVSTDKIIATELLKTKKEDKLNSPTHQRLEIEIDYPDNDLKQKDCSPVYSENQLKIVEGIPMGKPPISPQTKPSINLEAAEWQRKQRELTQSPSGPPQSVQVTNVIVHVDSQSPQSITANRSITPVQTSGGNTPVMQRTPSSTSSLQKTPPKHEIRQSVEAFCWKELKKLKQQEDMQLQMQLQLTPFGYAEDPIITHRSRSMSPTSSRNSRRSTSLPREVQRQRRMEEAEISRPNQIMQRHYMQRPNEQLYGQIRGQPTYNPNFQRNSPQRSTVSTNMPGMYEDYSKRPIFKRGSLTNQSTVEPQFLYNKKVSFHSSQNTENSQVWPTKNGFTQSPPQRRMDGKRESGDDDVFLPDSKPNGNAPPVNEPIYGTKSNGETKVDSINDKLYGNKMIPEQMQLTRDEIFLINQQRQKQLMMARAAQMERESPYATRGQFESPYGSRQFESPYGTRPPMESPYGTRQDINYGRPLPSEPIYGARHPQSGELFYGKRNQMDRESLYGSRPSIREPIYGTRPMPNIMEREPMYNIDNPYANRPNPNGLRYDMPPSDVYGSRQFMNRQPQSIREPIYGTKQDSIYGSKQSVMDPIYGRNGQQRPSVVNNQVCDMYGKIHEPGKMLSPTPTQKSGVLYGQLQRNSNAPPMQHQSYNQLQANNFVRGSRLTASVNDMYQRYNTDPRSQQYNEPPNRPLPPIPNDSKTKFLQLRRKQSMASESDINPNEAQRILSIRDPQMINRAVVGK
ncbi:PREDICTED: uncharacterized protein LOC108556932 [Nicrophorus vespilloides]|uniref:Uncharacterized protein LOC108556932 n=1 Tax=Nicrophorus vespilloides TaxID=110193 RepID=A0ABM1M2G6_NICVS|nr:PREDICTED: uncharacterized protein LOC108556932 [Nicrophorus vespilloides]XP_017768767.1 PREDICTED: uncharacterized protein LOC108556932 [Nicrophorus vespilloides]